MKKNFPFALLCNSQCKHTITATQSTFLPWRFGLYQRPSSEEDCSIPLPVLATIVMRRGKKSVVRVAQRVAPLVPVQGLPSFFYCLFDPSSIFVGFSVQNSGCHEMHGQSVLICFAQISCYVASLSWQEPEEELNKLLLMKVSDRDRNVKVKILVVFK